MSAGEISVLDLPVGTTADLSDGDYFLFINDGVLSIITRPDLYADIIVNAKGDKGDVGATGAVGPIGPAGATGDTGAKGDTGATGAAGINGTNGTNGDTGWSPILAIVPDGARLVLQVYDWTGGTGTKPATGSYIGSSGLTSTIALAVDISNSASISTISSGLSSTNSTVSSISSGLNTQVSAVSSVSASLSTTAATLSSTNSAVSAISSGLSITTSSASSVSSGLSSTQAGLSNTNSSVSAISSSLSANTSSISAISGSLSALNGTLGATTPNTASVTTLQAITAIQFPQMTLATLPSASTYSGYCIDVTDATGGAKVCRSDGTNWKILNTTTTVS